MNVVHSGSAGGKSIRAGALALPLVIVLAACESEPATRPASLLSTPLTIEPDTTTFALMDGDPPPASTPEPTADVSVASEPEPEEEEEEDSSPYAYPAWNGYDLDCADVGHTVKVTGGDPHRLDRDGDGWGCESY
ncbi:MAG TPA: hypothetical protein VF584_17205 [Longimicrobium sp.]|jgi:hypothetical protein